MPALPPGPLRIAERKIVIEHLAVNIKLPVRAGKMEHYLVLTLRLCQHGEWNADGHLPPIRMLGGMRSAVASSTGTEPSGILHAG